MNLLLTIAVVGCALALVAVLLNRRAKLADDGVAEFRRQLGALKPDASRPVIRPVRGADAFDIESDDRVSDVVDEGDDDSGA